MSGQLPQKKSALDARPRRSRPAAPDAIPSGKENGKRGTISDEEIYREIYNAIVENRLPPGSKLGQDELGDIFGVSKTRVRPVLHLLAQQKIVVIEPMRGAFVAHPSVEEARAVNSARQILEEGVVRVAVRKASPRHIEGLRENVTEEQAARLRNDTGWAHTLTGHFHCKLAEITGNAVIVDLVRELISRDSLVVALYQKPTAVGCSLTGHTELIDTIASGDEEAAAACMRKHLQEVVESLDLDAEKGKSGQLRTAFRHLRDPE
jgi:DNA-binding GntR family transcriptional regulator